MGTVDIDRSGFTRPPDVDGISVDRTPYLQVDDPTETTQFSLAGFGVIVVPDVVDGQAQTMTGKADELLVTVTDRRMIVVMAKGHFDDGAVDIHKLGNIYLMEIPLDLIEAVTLTYRKGLVGAAKPAGIIAGVAAGSRFGALIEPFVDVKGPGEGSKVKDPSPFAASLIDLCLARLTTEAAAAARHIGWQPDDDHDQIFFLWEDSARDFLEEKGQPVPIDSSPPPGGIAEGPPRTPEHQVVHEPAWRADPHDPSQLRWWDGSRWTGHTHPTAGENQPATSEPNRQTPALSTGPVLPVYLAIDSSESSIPWIQAAVSRLELMTQSLTASAAAGNSLLLAVIDFAAKPRLATPLSAPSLPSAQIRSGPTAADHDGLVRYLRWLLDHDLNWFRDQGIRSFRPTVVLLTGGQPLPVDVSPLVGPDSPFRPNVVAFGIGPAAEATVRSLGTLATYVDDTTLASPVLVTNAMDAVERTVVKAVAAVGAGDSPSLAFATSIAGFKP